MSMFSNGNTRLRRLVIFELICGGGIIVIGQVLGNLPSQDWMEPIHIKKIAFWLGTAQVLLKALEWFFNKTSAMFKNHEFDTDHIEKPKP